jgi:hypothetical protein
MIFFSSGIYRTLSVVLFIYDSVALCKYFILTFKPQVNRSSSAPTTSPLTIFKRVPSTSQYHQEITALIISNYHRPSFIMWPFKSNDKSAMDDSADAFPPPPTVYTPKVQIATFPSAHNTISQPFPQRGGAPLNSPKKKNV